MERKVLFLKSGMKEVNDKWLAQHIELFPNGIVVIVKVDVYFAAGANGDPTTEGSLTATHDGHTVVNIVSPSVPLKPMGSSKQWSREMLSIGGQKISIGFGGKGEIRESGWLPKYLYIKIER